MEMGSSSSGTDDSKYKSMYEERLNPFNEVSAHGDDFDAVNCSLMMMLMLMLMMLVLMQFSQMEKQRKLQELSVGDRLVLQTTLTCVSSHAGRR